MLKKNGYFCFIFEKAEMIKKSKLKTFIKVGLTLFAG